MRCYAKKIKRFFLLTTPKSMKHLFKPLLLVVMDKYLIENILQQLSLTEEREKT